MRKELGRVLFGVLITFMLVALAFVPVAGPSNQRITASPKTMGPTRDGISISCVGGNCRRVNPNAEDLYTVLNNDQRGPVPMSTEGRSANDNKWAVLAGVSDYPGTSMDLQYCHWDVYQTRSKLLQLGWPDSHIHLLLNASATSTNILNEIAWMKGQENATSQTYFHYSGHGNSHTFYVYGSTMSDSTLGNAFNGRKATQNVIVMDTCFAGSFTALQLSGTISIMACSDNEYSYDGMWTPNFMQAITGNTVSIESAFATAKQVVSQQTSGQQNALMWDNVPGDLYLGDQAPTIGTIPPFSTPEDTPLVMNLDAYGHDAEDSGASLKWFVSNYDPVAIYSINGEYAANHTITLVPVANYYGTTNVEVTLEDSVLLMTKKIVFATWTSVDDPPSTSKIDRPYATVLRTQPEILKLYGSDIDDKATDLVAKFEVSPNGTGQWQPLTSTAQYKGGHWEAIWVPAKDAALGTYDVKGRLKDPGNIYSGWLTLPNLLTVRDNLPVVTTLAVPPTGVERTKNVTFTVVGIDVEDALEKLSVDLEMKPPGTASFKQVGTTTLVSDHWNVTVGIDVDSMLGMYDVRARLRDADGTYGDYLYKNGSLEVKNCRPFVTDIIPDKLTVLRGADLSIMVNGFDPEDLNNDLNLVVQYEGPDGKWVDLDGVKLGSDQWTGKFSPDLTEALGNYSFRAQLTDTSGASSDWYLMNDTVQVLNNPPVVTGVQMGTTSVYRTRTITAFIEGSDVETTRSELLVEAQLSPLGKNAWDTNGIGAIRWNAANGTFAVTIAPDAHFAPGSYDLRVRLMDGDDVAGPWFIPKGPINVQNAPPVIDLVAPSLINEGQPVTFDATGSKDPEGGSLTFSWDFGDASVGVGPKLTHTYKAHGSDTLKLKVKDIDGLEVEKDLPLTVNGLPAGDVSSLQGTGFNNYNVNFHSSDIKDPEGSTLTYKWDFNVDDINGVDSTDPNPTFNYGKPGTYNYKVTITDANGGTVVKTGTVIVNSVSSVTVGLIVILLAVIVAIAVVAVILMRKRRRRRAAVLQPTATARVPVRSLLAEDDL